MAASGWRPRDGGLGEEEEEGRLENAKNINFNFFLLRFHTLFQTVMRWGVASAGGAWLPPGGAWLPPGGVASAGGGRGFRRGAWRGKSPYSGALTL